jgi:hypothetical protein
MDSDTTEIKALRRTVWRTAVAAKVERFESLLDAPASRKYFGEPFVKDLSLRIERLFRLQVVLGSLYTVLMLSLLAAQDATKSEFQILGYSFKNLSYYKEFLLMGAAFVSPVLSAISAYHRYLSELRKVALRKLFPNASVLEFASNVYLDNFLDALVKDRGVGYRRPHGITTALVAILAIALLALALALLGASFVLQISVIYDVATHPSTTPLLNTFIVAFSLGAIALSWLIGALQLPLPEVDLEGSVRLSELRNRDPARYQETIKRLGAESRKQEESWNLFSSVGIFALIFPAVATLLWPTPSTEIWALLLKATLGVLAVTFLSSELAQKLKLAILRRYFKRYPEGSDPSLKAYSRATRLITLGRLTTSIVVSLLFSILLLRAT